MKDIVIMSVVCMVVGSFGGLFKDSLFCDFGIIVVKEVIVWVGIEVD